VRGDPPSVSGALRRGTTLTAGTGTWSNGPTAYEYQWQRLAAGGWESIDGETESTYLVTSEDLGRRLRVAVVATNPDGSAAAASNPTAPVGAQGVNRAASQSKSKGKSSVKAKSSAKKKQPKTKKKTKKRTKRTHR
jgi:hypothetical protein